MAKGVEGIKGSFLEEAALGERSPQNGEESLEGWEASAGLGLEEAVRRGHPPLPPRPEGTGRRWDWRETELTQASHRGWPACSLSWVWELCGWTKLLLGSSWVGKEWGKAGQGLQLKPIFLFRPDTHRPFVEPGILLSLREKPASHHRPLNQWRSKCWR